MEPTSYQRQCNLIKTRPRLTMSVARSGFNQIERQCDVDKTLFKVVRLLGYTISPDHQLEDCIFRNDQDVLIVLH